jgi:hypothetical protein
MTLQDYLFLVGALLSIIGAGLAVRISFLDVRDNMDEFINDLARQGRWQKYAAFLNLFTAFVLLAAQFLVKS